MTKEKLMKVFEECERTRQGIRVEITMTNGDIETVINTNQSLNTKKKYYDRFFNDDLVNIKNERIRIIDAALIQIRRTPKSITVFEEVK